MRFSIRLLIVPVLALALALGSGCGTVLFHPYRDGMLAEGAVVLPVPHVRQEHAQSCGWAVASMLFKYYDQPIRDEDRELLLREPESDDGVTGLALKELLERNGFRAIIFAGGQLDDEGPRGVSYHIGRGWPLVVMISPEGSRHHYVVVSGLDELRELVVMVEPVRGEVICGWQDFMELWARGNCFTLLAVPEKLVGREDVELSPE
jgi:ABC-type bacteriocin/lantibiotic exporter with double-glycine peptidase domain